ncbi:MAG TPA: hypothetical protein VGQ71_04660 [Terriglobales bacterium]|nr:hypothetical protein [Terriglobales bacterium]
MQADFAVELGADDPHLEVPWVSPDGRSRYYDLKQRPELLLQIAEASRNREMGEFLTAINSPGCMLESAKCDTWLSNELNEEELIFGASWKFGSYVDLIFADCRPRLVFTAHENFAGRICGLLKRAPEISAAAEFIIRRCYYQAEVMSTTSAAGPQEGFYFTLYLSGYGDDEDEARQRWGIGLKLAENALLQLSAKHRRGADQTTPEATGAATYPFA